MTKNYYDKEYGCGQFEGIGFHIVRDDIDYVESDSFDALISEGEKTMDDYYAWEGRLWKEMFNNVQIIPDDFEIKEEA